MYCWAYPSKQKNLNNDEEKNIFTSEQILCKNHFSTETIMCQRPPYTCKNLSSGIKGIDCSLQKKKNAYIAHMHI